MATTTWHNRGREADSPREMTAPGWKDTLLRVKSEIKDDKLSLISAAMAYYALFAFVPAITSMILIYAWISDPNQISQQLDQASRFLPGEVQDILKSQLTTLASKPQEALGLGAIGALLFSLWSASKGSKAIMEAMNIIYDEVDKRGFFKLNSVALLLTLIGACLSVLAIGVIVGIPAIASQFNIPSALQVGVTVISWIILLFLFSFFLAVIYRYAPHRNGPKWRWVSWGAAFSAVLWAIVSALFSWYATEFGNFNKTYGSLGAVIVLMTWFYLTSFVILIGGEINAELEHQTKKDTTKGSPRPMGSRGARMADTIGKSAP